MKHLGFCSFFVLFVLALAACIPADTSTVETPVNMAIKAVAPSSTAEPLRERPYRSYPAPTGYPGFRQYYQKRCYPGCHSYGTPAATPEAVVVVEPTQERPHRSYPAPTGYPGFRQYYQKRCYPGCHSYGTPAPTRVHP